MKKPGFFIIGAPKCGTTALASWLRDHPQVYFSPVKEPHHFNTDHNYVLTPERDQYEALFSGARQEHRAVGEGSVSYLFSNDAVPSIEKYTQFQAKYIVLLRNPIKMAPSHHAHLRFAGDEHIKSFAKAWDYSDARWRGEAVTSRCPDPRVLAYKKVCLLGAQLERLYRTVPRQRVRGNAKNCA